MIPAPKCGVAAHAEERGFLLVGVAVFILVLTILGLSLFSLSGFESQFMIRSMREDQAFSLAAGGIQRARFALMATDSLQSVKSYLPRDGVVSAVAIQNPDPTVATDGDSVGPVNPNQRVWIRVRAQSGDAEVTMQARYAPGETNDLYKRLITATVVEVNKPYTLKPTHGPYTYLSGLIAVPKGSGDTTWNDPPAPPSDFPGRPPIKGIPGLTAPDVAPYIAAHLPPVPNVTPVGGVYTLDAGLSPFRYFSSPQSGIPGPVPPDKWNVWNVTGPIEIRVGGVVVWLVDTGMLFGAKVKISQLPPPALPGRLIIVSRSLSSGEGIDFDYGIDDGIPGVASSGVPLILVSNGTIQIGDDNPTSNTTNTMVGFLSAYCDRALIIGPVAGHDMHLWHLPSMLTPYSGAGSTIIDELYALNILPGVNAGTGALYTMDAGTWDYVATGLTP